MVQTPAKAATAPMRALAVALAALALCWAALVNGQPFSHPDSIGYVRGPDVAVMKLAGGRFATDWAKYQPPAAIMPKGGDAKAASYDDKEVMAGRSIYYGVLAYLGALTGGFWLTVLVQGLGVAWLVEIVMRALGAARLRTYAAVMALIAVATPAPFFVGFIMPDIWAGIGIGAVAALFALAGRLKRIDITALGGMTVFAAMAHNSVPPVLAVMTVAGAALWFVRRRTQPSPVAGLAVGALSLTAAIVGTLAFNLMVTHTAGKPPVQPPFLSARLVADGTGTRYAQERCHGQFVVCRYADRFPMGVDDFLWGLNGQDAVFQTASPADRRALGAEQTRFALAVVRAYPLQQIAASTRNALDQLVVTELSDFNYKRSLRTSLTLRMPPKAAATLSRTLAFREGWPLAPIFALQSITALLALGAAAWLSRPGARLEAKTSPALIFAALVVVGIIANAGVCGVLSTLYGRYEGRVIWLLPLAASVLALAPSQVRATIARVLQPARA